MRKMKPQNSIWHERLSSDLTPAPLGRSQHSPARRYRPRGRCKAATGAWAITLYGMCRLLHCVGWVLYTVHPSKLQYDRLQLEVRLQHGNAPFLAEAERLTQAIALDFAGGDDQVRDRLRFYDGTQARNRAEHGDAMHHPALQPGIVIEKANGAESKVRILPQFTQDELPTPSGAVDERCLASGIGTLLHVVQDTIRTPCSYCQGAEEQRIEQKESERLHWGKAHHGDYI
jgi:hypothetical protein